MPYSAFEANSISRIRIPKHGPRILAFAITKLCDHHCWHCSRESSKAAGAEMAIDELVRIVEAALDTGDLQTVVLTGGDPLLHSAFPTLLKELRLLIGPNNAIKINTTGNLICTETIELLRAFRVTEVILSLDSVREEVHDSLRGKQGSYRETIHALTLLIQSGILTQIKMTVQRKTYSEIEALVRLCVSKGVGRICLGRLIPTGRALPRYWECAVPWINMQREIERIRKYPDLLPRVVYDEPLVLLLRKDRLRLAELASEFEVVAGCPAGREALYVEPGGSALACPCLPVPVGNVVDEPISKVWQDSLLLHALRTRKELRGACGNCNFRNVCGGCRATAFGIWGNVMAEDPFCPAVNFTRHRGPMVC